MRIGRYITIMVDYGDIAIHQEAGPATHMPNILFISRIIPNPEGHGGSQRAFSLLKALSTIGEVDVIIPYRPGDEDVIATPINWTEKLARSANKINIPAWASASKKWPGLPYRLATIIDTIFLGSPDVPRIPKRDLFRLKPHGPSKKYDIVFAGRLSCAVLADDLIKLNIITARRRIADFDDILSRVCERQINQDGAFQGRLWRFIRKIDCARIYRAEQRVLDSWDAISVCSDIDVGNLSSRGIGLNVFSLPNVVEKSLIPLTKASYTRILFVGSFSHRPNVQGLMRFLVECWPIIRAIDPTAELTVVGMMPTADLAAEITKAGAKLHENVPNVVPYYRNADIVVSPIFFGGGTRVKLIEAMAYGRAIVSTTLGAEGLGLVNNIHGLIVDDMHEFACAVIRLGAQPELRDLLVRNARALQESHFEPRVMDKAVYAMVNL